MRRDPTLFRKRFAAYKLGKMPYNAGKPMTDEEYYGILERVALDNNLEWNKYRLQEGVKALSEDEEVMRLVNDHSYDYRGYYNKYPDSKATASTHWPDEFKTYLHPTFSNQSIYASNNPNYVGKTEYNPYGLEGGSWTGKHEDVFVPAKWLTGLPNYQKGKRPTAKQIAGHAWATENPTRRGLNANGTWRQYPDPAGTGLMNVGPGALVNNAAAKKAKVVGVVPDKKSYTTAEVEQPWINNYNEGWPKIADSYDKKYGTAAYPHPSDTINVKTQLLAVSTRGKNGSLRQTEWPAFYLAMADGDLATQLVESRTMFGEDGNKKYDNDRVRREAEALWPGMFNVSWDKNDPKKKTLVVPRKKTALK